MACFPRLPARAAYIHLDNAARRNALSLAVLRDLLSQLTRHLTSPKTGRLLTLPPFQPHLLAAMGKGGGRRGGGEQDARYRWLIDAREWREQRRGLPDVLVLRSEGPVFSSGHDLAEVARLTTHAERRVLFDACADVMALIRRSPAVVVCAVQGLATAAGCQLALSCDVAVARAGTPFQLPGMSIGLPCTSPATAVARRVPPALAYRMFATAEPVRADQLGGAVDVVHSESVDDWEARVHEVVARLVALPGQPQALGKWAFWTQARVGTKNDAGVDVDVAVDDEYAEAARWAAEAMALHAESADAQEGIASFLGKRPPGWST